jgi:hypothetical protein
MISIQWLKQIITGSPANRYNYLVALPLSNPPEEFLPLSNAAFPMTCIELDRDRKDQDNNDIIYNHWASRAITQGLTQLTNRGISEFLQLVRTATFAYFKVRRNGSSHYYFMKLSNNLQAHDITL